MKVFERDGKINFVDEKNVFVGFDYQACCCEQFGYFFSKTEPLTEDVKGEKDFDPEGYCFDKEFYKTQDAGEAGAEAIFRLTHPSKPEIFLTLFNHHNGYYAHGFTMTVDGENLRSASL